MTNKNSKFAKFKNHPASAGYLNFDLCVLHFDFARKRAGFTLLETIVALAIIIAAVIGPVVLTTQGLSSFGFSKNKIVALNLAQEGLELVLVLRENNVLCDKIKGGGSWDWFRDPNQGSNGNSKIDDEILEIDATRTQILDCDTKSITYPTLFFTSNTKLRLDVDGTYNYSNGPETVFTRAIRIRKPDSNEDVGAGKEINKNDIREITSTVRWKERGRDREMILQEKLYNWR